MKGKLKRTIARFLVNSRGWKTDRKIVVIESDDWGSIRMPSREVYNKCLKEGYPVDKNVYERYDSLASEDDLEMLFDLLSSYKDKNGNHPVITANALTSNPDFEKIRAGGYQQYAYESITETFKKYPRHNRCFELWKEGMDSGVFFPQSHGREHLNVSMFMNALQSGDPDVHFGFENGMPGCISKIKQWNNYVEALRYTSQSDKEKKLSIVLEGLEKFVDLFGYRSQSFIPPNYYWSTDYNEEISKKGVRFIQGIKKLKEPLFDGGVKRHGRYQGKKNKFGQIDIVRNSMFEPAFFSNGNKDVVNLCLADIEAAFKMKKPAIICTHRLNYVGWLDVKNRDNNLKMLSELIKGIMKKWPKSEFYNTEEIGRLICEKY